MTNIKLKATDPQYSFITKDKIYTVDMVFSDGDYHIIDDAGDGFTIWRQDVGNGKHWEKVSGFDKYDLLNGDVVVMRCGYNLIFFKDYAGNGDTFVDVDLGYEPVDSYGYDLSHNRVRDYDIIEVWRPAFAGIFYPASGNFNNYECVFKRDDRKRMTVEDIEAALGYKIEVVDRG